MKWIGFTWGQWNHRREMIEWIEEIFCRSKLSYFVITHEERRKNNNKFLLLFFPFQSFFYTFERQQGKKAFSLKSSTFTALNTKSAFKTYGCHDKWTSLSPIIWRHLSILHHEINGSTNLNLFESAGREWFLPPVYLAAQPVLRKMRNY